MNALKYTAIALTLLCSCSSPPGPPESTEPDTDLSADAGRDVRSTSAPSCAPSGPTAVPCDDLIEGESIQRWRVQASDNSTAELSTDERAVRGAQALRVETDTQRLVLTYEPVEAIDASGKALLQFGLRAFNDNPRWGWPRSTPRVTLTDSSGVARSIEPVSGRLPSGGESWKRLALPLAGANGWTLTDEGGAGSFNLASITSIAIEFRSHGNLGFWTVIDGLAFTGADEVCEADCRHECNNRGYCDHQKMRCVCEQGAIGDDCGQCSHGYVRQDSHCVLEEDGDYDYWPNPVSQANSSPWLAAHHEDVEVVRPRALVLNYANPVDPEQAEQLMADEARAVREASKYRGYSNPETPAQVEYEWVEIIDMRDGVDGRDPAPANWEFETSTLFPRRADGEEGNWGVDYARFFEPSYAHHYGFEDPDNPGQYLGLCELIERGIIHELWFLQAPHPDDVKRAEVLEFKQRYNTENTAIAGSFNRCAGNGCFDPDVPHCAASVRIVSKNYRRGTGCRLHTVGHNLEKMVRSQSVPSLNEWFEPFANFNLDLKYGMPFPSLYQARCDQDSCISYPEPNTVEVIHRGEQLTIEDWDGACGNVHFAPNGRKDYDFKNEAEVNSTCQDFGSRGRGCGQDVATLTSDQTWQSLEAVDNDCSGRFNKWWFQNMPAYGAEQYFDDGRKMASVWPYLYY